MRQSTTIQKITAFSVLFVFILCVTPKIFFHELIADHRDGPKCALEHNATVVHTKTFDCHFDDLVVTVPFVLNAEASQEFLRNYALTKQFGFYTSHSIYYFQLKENRGPPVV